MLLRPAFRVLARLPADFGNADGGRRVESHPEIPGDGFDSFVGPLDYVFVPEDKRRYPRISIECVPGRFVIAQYLQRFVDRRLRVRNSRRLSLLLLLRPPDARTGSPRVGNRVSNAVTPLELNNLWVGVGRQQDCRHLAKQRRISPSEVFHHPREAFHSEHTIWRGAAMKH